MCVPLVSRSSEPGDGTKPAEKQCQQSRLHWKPRPQYVEAIRVKHSHCGAAQPVHDGGAVEQNGFEITKRNSTQAV